MYTGLTDYDQQATLSRASPRAGSPTRTHGLGVPAAQGVLFHNGREVDAEAVKLNIERIKNPAIGAMAPGAR